MYMREKTKAIKVGNIVIGGDNPISIQTMYKKPLTIGVDEILADMRHYASYGCDIIRFSVPDADCVDNLKKVCDAGIMPVVADIHFDYKLALASIEAGVAKVRINPGNIGAEWKVAEVIKACKETGTPIRIGINGGSLPSSLRHISLEEGIMQAAEAEVEILQKYNFDNALFSLKASTEDVTLLVNRAFAKRYNYPLHLGVTEAGTLIPSLVKSSYVLVNLLREGIGSTIRVSISDIPDYEVIAGKEILKTAGLEGYSKGVRVVSCPRCGRASFDNGGAFVKELEAYLQTVKKDICVAVMGCVVNGPGEAKEADLGITGAGNTIIIFKNGEVLKKVDIKDAMEEFKNEIEKF
ncbi:MAG: flavodoxin-dependent (E)-4-hydroxy-3-methylbut-2-enyl-diphosphate synthase [Spirochaetales bacterium]|nr:flavodoxin-dependent (E)-4-hydroxy-3-methylbut-2-enyl-diphosphate synthase [Spirochaetales bacterium]